MHPSLEQATTSERIKKNISKRRKTFLQNACDYSPLGLTFKEFCSSEGLKPDPEVRGRKYCPLPWGMRRTGDLSRLAPWEEARQTLFRSPDHQRCRLKAKLLLPSQPLFPLYKWFLPWKFYHDYVPSPCQSWCYAFLRSKFSHPNPIIFSVFKNLSFSSTWVRQVFTVKRAKLFWEI